jgi:hypothetical protein
MRFLTALLVSLLGVAGCCERHKCSPSSKLVIRDAAGGKIPGATAAGLATLMLCPPTDDCSYQFRGEGTITVTADGYKPAAVAVTTQMDDCERIVAQSVEVTLAPAAEAVETTSRTLLLGSHCN